MCHLDKSKQQVKNQEGQLTLDLLLLHLEGCARSLGRLLQHKDGGIFFLAGVAQLLE
jgi:hypothetical protein